MVPAFHQPEVVGYYPVNNVAVPAAAGNFIAADPPEEGRLVRIGNMLQVAEIILNSVKRSNSI